MADEQSFLGTGWSFPPAFSDGGRDVALVSGVEDIQQSLQILLSTRLGERAMQETFGCALDSVLFEEMNATILNSVNNLVSNAILSHEPRITLEGVDVSASDDEQGLLLLSIVYTVRATNSRFNMVYPFYLNEANNPGT